MRAQAARLFSRVWAWLSAPGAPTRITTGVVAWAIIVWQILAVCAPLSADRSRWGGHDWDATEAFRYLTVASFKVWHQFPFWNPYSGGGYTAWGFIDSDTTVISPWLPFYLLLDLRHALEWEVIGSALLAAWGTWLFAGRFSKSAAGRALVCVAFVVNGRWSLQIASGHAWHLYYCWVPWALYYYERAHGRGQGEKAHWGYACAAGAFMALMVYTGAIYPFPQTIFLMLLYAPLVAIVTRSLRPLWMAAIMGTTTIGFSAPRLFAVLDVFSAAPRLVDSHETMDLNVLVAALTNDEQSFYGAGVRTSQWGWHEWGMYVGWAVVALVLIAVIAIRGVRVFSLKWTGVVLVALSFGAVHPKAPWALLHHAPVFKSLHVPSRWIYPACLLLTVLAAVLIDRVVARLPGWRLPKELVLLVGIGWIAADIANVSVRPMTSTFWMQGAKPITPTPHAPFVQERVVPPHLDYQSRDWAIPSLPAYMANTGVLEVTAVAPLSIYERDAEGRIRGQGAKGRGASDYRGEVFLDGGKGTAEFVRWTPNELVVRYRGAEPGDLVVVNQNYDRGWRADGAPALNHRDTIAARVSSSEGEITFRYRPRSLAAGLAVFGMTCALIAAARRWERRRAPAQAKGKAVPAS